MIGRTLKAAAIAVSAALSLAASPAAALTLYETFGADGVFGFDPAHLAGTAVSHFANATNLSLAGGHVFWQDGQTIYEANSDLTGVTPLWHNAAIPIDIAIDPSSGYLYETFGADGVFGVDPVHPAGTEVTHLADATNLSLAGGHVFWQDGQTIYEANSDLTGVTALWRNAAIPTDFAIDPNSGYLYETFGADGVFGFDPAHFAGTAVSHFANATNLSLAGGHVFWQDGRTIYEANSDLTGVTQLWRNAAIPTDFAIEVPAPGVPESGTWVLMIAGFGLAGAALRRNRGRTGAGIRRATA